ncbi:hypothetical protein DFH28DRAFT_878051 [Melampsora americana]|nr:hypothetical protein DFH28DRAFT_878051 [Melampsora americana]
MPRNDESKPTFDHRRLGNLSPTEVKAHFTRALSRPENATWWPFIRGYSIGYATEVIPSLVKLLLVRLIGLSRGRTRSGALGRSLYTLIRRLLELILKGFRPNGFAMACAIAMGGGRWGESAVRPAMERFVRANRVMTRICRRFMRSLKRKPLENICLSERETRVLDVMSTFASTSIASLIAITVLQTRQTPKQTQSPLNPITTPYPTISTEPEVPFAAPVKEGSLSPHSLPATSNRSDLKPRRFPQSSTLDLTLFFTVRALDTIIQFIYASYSSPYLALLKRCSDIILFQLSCWRIMWCWFYKPQRLPYTYVKWITALAEMDYRLLRLIRLGKAGKFHYGKKPLSYDVSEMGRAIASDMGLEPMLGDPQFIDKLSCEIVHGKLGASDSCLVNSGRRWMKAWRRGMGIYLPVFTVPAILFNREKWINSPVKTLSHILIGSSRSAAFLSTFVALTWSGVCMGRSTAAHALLNLLSSSPVSTTYMDSNFAPQIGSFLAGWSIMIENKKRRGEMALYVAMRALYAAIDQILPARLLKNIKRHQWVSTWVERLTFALSIGTITSAVVHDSVHVRGIVKGIMTFAVGPHWQHKYSHSKIQPINPTDEKDDHLGVQNLTTV